MDYGSHDGIQEMPEAAVLDNIFGKYGLEQIDGSVPLDDAHVILVADRSHVVPQQTMGLAVKEAIGTKDGRILVEGTDIAAAVQAFGLDGVDDISSLEDPALYALALLMAGRFARGEVDRAMFEHVVLDERNKIMLLKILRARAPQDSLDQTRKTIYVFAGKGHFNDAFLNLLRECDIWYALVEPIGTEADSSEEQNEEYLQSFAGEDNQELQAQYDAGKDVLERELRNADGLIEELSAIDHYDEF